MSLITKEQLEEFIKSFPGWVKERDYFTRDRQIPPGDNYTFYTPINVVNEMLDLLPEETWKKSDWTFLCLPCKDGIFLEEIFWRLYEGLKEEIPDYIDRTDHILTKQLYGLSPCYVPEDVESLTVFERSINKKLYGRERFKSYAENSRILLYGGYRANHPKAYTKKFDNPYGNIWAMYKLVDGYVRDTFEIVKDKGKKTLRDLAEGVDKDMKFNVVIGNPPYNKGMDLDFVNLGFDLCTDYCVMITPAKWQTAADDQRTASKTIDYKQFRKQLVPHMSKVVFYPDCKDIFDIGQRDGITYYLLNKNKTFNKCEVVNKSILQRYFNGKEIREIRDRQSLLNIGNEIYNYVASNSNFRQFKFNVGNGKYQVWTNTQCPVGGSVGGGAGKGGYAFASDGTAQYISISRVIDISKGEKSPSGASQCTFSSDNRAECESFVSWLNTKFTRFFVAINVSKLTGILTDDYFRFVPAPPSGKFDHIYTDEELYKAFNLPQKYIDVIEAVIKERK